METIFTNGMWADDRPLDFYWIFFKFNEALNDPSIQAARIDNIFIFKNVNFLYKIEKIFSKQDHSTIIPTFLCLVVFDTGDYFPN